MEVSPPFPRACAVRLADEEAELTGILEACELECFEPEVARVFENAIERLFYSESFRIGKAVLPQRRVRSRLHLLDGMILRTADALGLDGVIYSASCDIYSPKVVRATMGSLFRVPLCCVPEIEPVLAACRDAGVESCAAVVSGQAELVGQCLFRKGTAVVIGNEGNGLPEEVSAACDRRVTIPMHGTIESLNAAMAAGIILWEVQKAAAAGNGGQ